MSIFEAIGGIGLFAVAGLAVGFFVIRARRRAKPASTGGLTEHRGHADVPPMTRKATKELTEIMRGKEATAAAGPFAPSPSPNNESEFTQMFGKPSFGATSSGFAAANFTLTAPRLLQRGQAAEIRFWVHLPRDREQIVRLAEEAHGQPSSQLVIKPEGPYPIEPGSMLAIRLHIPGMKCRDSQKRIVWTAEIASVGFVVEVPTEAAEGWHAGTGSIRVNGMQIAKISFVLTVVKETAACGPGVLHSTTISHRTAFASYASEDRAEVVARVQGMEAIHKGFKVFLDVADLRSGELWERALPERIQKADVFYLFWCRHSRDSEWVSKEWRLALAAKGLDFIDPIPLEEPANAPPPPELAAKHFNDPLLAFLNSAGGFSQNHRN